MLRFTLTLWIGLAIAAAAAAQVSPVTRTDTSAALDEDVHAPTPRPPPGYQLIPSVPGRAHRTRPEVGRWPRLFLISANVVFASVDYRRANFTARHGMTQLGGETLRLQRFDAPGASMALRLVPTRYLEFGLGLGVLRPIVGPPRPVMTTRSERVYVTGAYVAYWHGQLSLVTHVGAAALSAGVRVGWSRMVLDLGGDGPKSMRAARVAAGPQADLRAHLYRSLFVHVGGFVDMLQWPDAQLEIGLGLAHR